MAKLYELSAYCDQRVSALQEGERQLQQRQSSLTVYYLTRHVNSYLIKMCIRDRAGSSLAEWEAFCVFMESDACVSAPRASDFLSLYSCSSVEQLPILEQWAKRKEHTLAAVLGWEEDGDRSTLDAHEKGDGPHGIVAGLSLIHIS